MTTSVYIGVLVAGLLIAGGSVAFAIWRKSWKSLTTWIVLSIGVGIAVGATFQYFYPFVFKGDPKALNDTALFAHDLHGFFKKLFMSALQMVIVPLIFTSIASGVLSMGEGKGLGRVGLKTMAYYMTTSVLAILVGLVLVNLIEPGVGATLTLQQAPPKLAAVDQTASQFLFDFILKLIPLNPIEAMVKGNILQIIVFALLVGYFTTKLPEPHRGTLSRFFQGFFDVMMRVVHLVLWLAPIGIYAIFVEVVAETGPGAFADLALYSLTVLVGLIVHGCFTLPLMVYLFGRGDPWKLAKAMHPALLTAFSTSSSSATLPVTMESLEERAGVSNRITSFVLPLGATVNMDGTALYECVAAIFIAQIYATQGMMEPLTITQQFLVVVTALAASIGAAGIPMAGLVTISIILRALGMPLEGVGYILAVDRVLDMFRTTVNVWSDSCGAAIIARTEGEDVVPARRS